MDPIANHLSRNQLRILIDGLEKVRAAMRKDDRINLDGLEYQEVLSLHARLVCTFESLLR